MDFEFICIYNPGFGTEEDVTPQIVHCSSEDVDAIKMIGIAQGVVELAYSFGEKPTKWYKTGRAGMSHHIVIVPLFSETKEDWRSGFWFSGQLPVHADCPAPEVSYRLVQLSFEQHLLKSGKPPPLGSKNHNEYWTMFASQRFKFNLSSVVTPNAVRLAPGSLNPAVKKQIEKIKQDFGIKDVLIIISEDGAAVYPGETSLRTRVALQRWLTQNLHTRNFPIPNQVRETIASDAVETTAETISVSNCEVIETGEAHKPEESSNWFSRTMFDMSSLSINMPSFLLNMPPLPTLSLNNMSFGSLSSTSVSSWWNANSEEEAPSEGLVAIQLAFFDIETGEPFSASIWRHGLYTYMSMYTTDISDESIMFDSLSNQLEGFNFAFEPPTRFHYLIHDPFKSTVVSTFPASTASNNEIVRSMIECPEPRQQVVRLGTTWLYFVRMNHGALAVFGKKNVTTQQPTLLGALHKDVQKWLDEYARKYL